MNRKIEVIAKRVMDRFVPSDTPPMQSRINKLFQRADGIPVEVAIASYVDDISQRVQHAAYGDVFAQHPLLALPQLITDVALDAAGSQELSHRQGSNIYKMFLENGYAVRNIKILPPLPIAKQRELAGVPQGIVVITRIHSSPQEPTEQIILTTLRNPHVIDGNIIYTEFQYQLTDHIGNNSYATSSWHVSVDPKNQETYITVPEEKFDYENGPLTIRCTFNGEYIATLGKITLLTLY